MGNPNKSKSKKRTRKIRIRLSDPNIPDSYVCEIFDSSVENDEESSIQEPSPEKKEDLAKPKNYFDLLMSKNSKKNGVIDSPSECDIIEICNDEESVRKNIQTNKKSKNSLALEINRQRKFESDSSEDENLLQIQRKCKLKEHKKHGTQRIEEEKEEENQVIIDVTEQKLTSEDSNPNEGLFRIFDSSKVVPSQKKKFSILNYFSKSETGLKNKIGSEKLEEITSVVNSLMTCEVENCLTPAKKLNPAKTCPNEKKITLNGINKENVKLAPLFCKKVNKIIDSDRQKARLDFLYKGSPSVTKKADIKSGENASIFPAVSHVQQRDNNECWSLRQISLPLPQIQDSDESVLQSTKKFSLEIRNSNIVNTSTVTREVQPSRHYLLRAKCEYVDLNLDSVIDGLKQKRDKFLARTREIEKLKSASSGTSCNDGTGFEELNALWTDKYKPNSDEILGNGAVVKKLKKWLQSWKSFDEELKVLAKFSRNSKNKLESDDDSSDDFIDENYGLKSPGNVCVISGPNGCGKTALVYALANELEFGVLELNASSKRTGKKVLSDLQEATQSHKVHRVNLLQAEVPLKETKKKRGRKRKITNKSTKVSDHANDCKISLILIEDADIVFEEHDEGFYSAVASLVQTSKRPIIFLSNEPNCHCLYNLKTEQCLILEMEVPSFYKSCAVLDIVSYLEGDTFDRELLESIVCQNKFDLRKSMLQLQFWIHSSKTSIDLQREFDLGHLWWGLSKFLFQQDIKHSLNFRSQKRKRGNDLFDSSDEEEGAVTKKFKSDSDNAQQYSVVNTGAVAKKSKPSMASYFRVLDLISSLDVLCLSGSQEPIPGFGYKPKDSLSLSENMEESSWPRKRFAEHLTDEMVSLSSSIFTRSLKKCSEERQLNIGSPCWEEIRWRNSQEKASEELSMLISLQRGRDRRSLPLDYLPALRNICRTERNRSEMNPKRKNRFYHYLHNLGFDLTDDNLEINCDAFDR